MAKLRKASCYRHLERPYTRKSKKKSKSYIRGAPYPKITSFDMGNFNSNFEYAVSLIATNNLQIRHNALEAIRIAINKELDDKVGKDNYHFQIRAYPHHVLREHATATGAGADRFSTGMAHSFGKPVGLAAQITRGKKVLVVYTNKKHVEAAKKALKQGLYKSAMTGTIQITPIAKQ